MPPHRQPQCLWLLLALGGSRGVGTLKDVGISLAPYGRPRAPPPVRVLRCRYKWQACTPGLSCLLFPYNLRAFLTLIFLFLF